MADFTSRRLPSLSPRESVSRKNSVEKPVNIGQGYGHGYESPPSTASDQAERNNSITSTLTINSCPSVTNTLLSIPTLGKSNRFNILSLSDKKETIEIDGNNQSSKSMQLNKEKERERDRERERERDRERARPQARKGLMGFKGFQAAMGKSLQLSNKTGRPKSHITAKKKKEINDAVGTNFRKNEEEEEEEEDKTKGES